jgi:dTDP-4-dehydrorhamnose reductase
MKVLITGANGFLGHYLTELLLKKGYEVIATGKGSSRLFFPGYSCLSYEEMDFTDINAVHKVFARHQPDTIVHAGAMSKPDECELNRAAAFLVNVSGTEKLLNAAADHQSHFIFVSTDFVFDGNKGMYTESDIPSPVNYYGYTKLQAEDAVRKYPGNWSIARTVLVYGRPVAGRDNIITRVKQKLERGEEYAVVNDQVRTPTFVKDLANGITLMIEKNADGIFHISGKDILTPFEMAVRTAGLLGLDTALLCKVTAADFTEPARRPLKTGFVIDKAVRELGFQPLSFEEGLKRTFC